MQPTRNARGTIGFLTAVVVGHIWLSVSPVFKPPWEPWPPIVPFMVEFVVPFLMNYFRPLLIALLGLVILWVWEEKRAGYLVAVVLAAIATAFGLFITAFNALNQEWLGLLSAGSVGAFPAVMALWYSLQGYRTGSSAHSGRT